MNEKPSAAVRVVRVYACVPGLGRLTRAELDIVRLVSEGLGNKEVAARLFASPRTVQAHLTHIYTKLGLTSRVQLAHEAMRRG